MPYFFRSRDVAHYSDIRNGGLLEPLKLVEEEGLVGNGEETFRRVLVFSERVQAVAISCENNGLELGRRASGNHASFSNGDGSCCLLLLFFFLFAHLRCTNFHEVQRAEKGVRGKKLHERQSNGSKKGNSIELDY